MCLPCEQRDTVVSCHTSQHANAGQLVWEQFSVVFLQLVDLFLIVRGNPVHRLSVVQGFMIAKEKCEINNMLTSPVFFMYSIEKGSPGCVCRRELPSDTGCMSWTLGWLAARSSREGNAPRPARALAMTPAACHRPPCKPCRPYPAEIYYKVISSKIGRPVNTYYSRVNSNI